MIRALIVLFIAILSVAPVSAAGPSLLGVGSDAVSNPVAAPALAASAPRPVAPAREPSWLSRFGSGFVDGVVNAIPNMWKTIKERPFTALAIVGGMVVAAVAAPAVAAVAGVALTVGTIGYTAYASGGDPTKIGQVVGETAFWGAAGMGLARGVSALRGAKTAATAESAAVRTATAAERNLPVLNNPLCFVAGTPVLTARGPRAIESITSGDEVLTWSPASKTTVTGALLAALALAPQPAVGRVGTLFRNEVAHVYDLTARLPDGRVTRVTGTAEHPFRARGVWTRLADLTPGTPITAIGGDAEVLAVARRASRERVYNFEVPGTHTYYVGAGLLAHNTCTGDKLVNASSGLRTALAENAAAATSKVDDVANATTSARDRVSTLLRDARQNTGTAGGHANEVRGVATGAERSATELRAAATEARAANPELAARLEGEAGRLERLAAQSRTAADALERRAASLPDADRIARQGKLIDDAIEADRAAVPTVDGKKPSTRAGAIDDAEQVVVGRSQVGAPRDLSAAKSPELRALEPRLLEVQAGLIRKELDAIRTLPRDQQLRFLRNTLQQELHRAKTPRPEIQGQMQRYGQSLDAMSDAQLQAELTARYAFLETLPQQTRAEFVANAFAGQRMTAIRPGNCAEWTALDDALAARSGAMPNPPGRGLSIKAVDANGQFKPCCVYCQTLADSLGVRVIR